MCQLLFFCGLFVDRDVDAKGAADKARVAAEEAAEE